MLSLTTAIWMDVKNKSCNGTATWKRPRKWRSNKSSKHISFSSTHGLPPRAHETVEKGGPGKGLLPLTCLKSWSDASCCPTYWLDSQLQDCDNVLCPNVTAMSDELISYVLDSPACSICKESPDQCFTTVQALRPDHCIQNVEAGIPSTLYTKENDLVEMKGDLPYVDAYISKRRSTQRWKTMASIRCTSQGLQPTLVCSSRHPMPSRWGTVQLWLVMPPVVSRKRERKRLYWGWFKMESVWLAVISSWRMNALLRNLGES